MRKILSRTEKQYKQCIVLRADLKLSKGKTVAQAAYASIIGYERAAVRDRKKWKE